MNEFKQIIERFESEEYASFCQNYKDRSVEELDTIIAEFQSLYMWQDPTGDRGDLISPEDWMVFSHWGPCNQTEFLAYLAIKIAVLMN
jgi:hypothetical protein